MTNQERLMRRVADTCETLAAQTDKKPIDITLDQIYTALPEEDQGELETARKGLVWCADCDHVVGKNAKQCDSCADARHSSSMFGRSVGLFGDFGHW